MRSAVINVMRVFIYLNERCLNIYNPVNLERRKKLNFCNLKKNRQIGVKCHQQEFLQVVSVCRDTACANKDILQSLLVLTDLMVGPVLY